MKIPRDVSAAKLINLLKHYGYQIIRQTGSHIRLSKNIDDYEHNITVPNHKPIKIGTLQNIANDVCSVNNLSLDEFYNQL